MKIDRRMLSESLLAVAVLACAVGSSSTVRAQEPATHDDTGGGSTRSTIGWAATGGGVGLLGAFGYSYYRVEAINDDEGFVAYRDSVPAGKDSCDAADAGYTGGPGAASPSEVQDMCSTADRWRVLGNYVFLPLGVISLGTGIYLLATDDSGSEEETAAVRLETTVGPQGGGLSLRATF